MDESISCGGKVLTDFIVVFSLDVYSELFSWGHGEERKRVKVEVEEFKSGRVGKFKSFERLDSFDRSDK